MITHLSHISLFVLDQDKAYDFYVNKLGCKVNTDVQMDHDGGEPTAGGHRWLTVNPPDQPDLEIILMPVMGLDEEAAAAMRLLLDKGVLGAGVWHTNNCQATYEELKAKGVHFKSEPKEQFYGIECIMTDGCGNWFSVTQTKEH